MSSDRATRGPLPLPVLPLAASEIPPSDALPRPAPLTGARREIWDRALPYLDVRDNAAHSLGAHALASALLNALPGARADVVLPAVLLHDTGWKMVDPADILPAIAQRSGPAAHETIRRHETEGAAIAAGILSDIGYPARDTERIVAIIDGHDTRRDALGVDDAVVRDADKLWRLTPHGLRTIGAWFALDRDQTLRFVGAHTYDRLFTEPARAVAATLVALVRTDLGDQATRPEHPPPRREGGSSVRLFRLIMDISGVILGGMDAHPPLGVVVTDPEGLIIGWTSGAERLLGYTDAEARGRSAAELLDAPALAGGEPAQGSERHPGLDVRHRDGHRLSVAVSRHTFAPGAYGTGAGSGSVLLIGPPSGPAAERLRQALSGWALQDSPLALTVYDTDLRCVWQSAAMQRLCGLPGEARPGHRLTEVFTGSDAVEWEERLRLAMATGEEQVSELKGTHLAEARSRVLSVSATPLRDAEGRIVGVCTLVSDVTERRRARERLSLLNDASLRIGSTLDIAQTARELTEVTVPRLTDVARVDLLEVILRGDEPAPGPLAGPVRLRRIAELTLAEGVTTAQHTAGEADVYLENSPAALCLATGRSALYRTNDEPPIRSYIDQSPERQAKVRRLGTHSWMLVPVKARGTTLGVVWFTRTRETPESFGADDLSLAEDLVARAAVCLDNARRFTRERVAALTLQRSLLPRRMPELSAVDIASRYLPAAQRSGVGGDWFDVIGLSGARVALVVGDVVGHGILAAATMGRLRTAVRTLADVDLAPEELLTRLDDLVIRLSAESGADAEPLGAQVAADIGATCLYAVYDPVSRRCSMALAGHPPPVVVRPDGTAGFLDVPVGPPLGLGGLPFEPAHVTLSEGSLLALYTDGLIHARHRDIGEGLDALRGALAAPPDSLDSLDSLCDHVVRTMLPDHSADDAALLLVRSRALDSGRVAVWDVDAEAAAVARVRSDAVRVLDEWGLEEAAFVTELVVSELVTNALRYGDPPIQLRLIHDRMLICEVSDSSNTAPHLRRARVLDEGGRGLLLVAQLTERWGTRQTAAGKTIWCEQPLTPAGAPLPLRRETPPPDHAVFGPRAD